MNELEKIVNHDLLFDFYGDLLTEHQKRIYEEVVFNDYSVSEVARDEGISRQSVYDMIRRCSDQLLSYEKRLGLVERFRRNRKRIEQILAETAAFEKDADPSHVNKISEISGDLLKDE